MTCSRVRVRSRELSDVLASRGASRHARRRPTMRDALSRRSGDGAPEPPGPPPTTAPADPTAPDPPTHPEATRADRHQRPSRSTSSKPPLNNLPGPGRLCNRFGHAPAPDCPRSPIRISQTARSPVRPRLLRPFLFLLLRPLTLHCRRRGAAGSEGAQQTRRGAADDLVRPPADPGAAGQEPRGATTPRDSSGMVPVRLA